MDRHVLALLHNEVKIMRADLADACCTAVNPAQQGGRWQPATVRSILRTLRRHAGMLGSAAAAG